MESKDTRPVVGQIEDHFSSGRLQPCRWTGSSWQPVAQPKKPARVTGLCPRCHSYCYGDCSAR